jgi:RNA-binding protein
MFTSKQRSNLKSIANAIESITQVGKGGINDNLIKSLSDALEARELIKVTVLNNAETEVDTIAKELSQKLKAETVTCIGKKIILYRKSKRQDFNHIEF